MPILSIIPADQVLAVAIKDATKSTSTVNPARITTAVQKMRPDWSVNKRRVKRLLRSMNNDAWKAAVLPSTSSTTSSAPIDTAPSADPSATPSSSTSTVDTLTESTSGGRRPGRAARAAAARRSKNAATAAASSSADDKSAGGNICDTAPASPGSPAGFSAAAVRVRSPAGVGDDCDANLVGDVPSSRDAPESSGAELPVLSPPPDVGSGAASSAGAPWDEVAVGGEESGVGGAGETDELSDSLRLEPDIELEPGVDLKADLGLAAATEHVANEANEGGAPAPPVLALEDIALTTTTVDDDAPLPVGAAAGDAATPADEGDPMMSTSVLELGFEMIHKDEATAAGAVAEEVSGSPGTKPGKAARKGWPWAWGRS